MIKSMTGFGRGAFSDDKINVIVEIKSVNHRYSDLNVRIPRKYTFLEEEIKNIVKNEVKRGKIEIMINIEALTSDELEVKLNSEIIKQYIDNFNSVKDEFGIDGDIDLNLIAGLPDVTKLVPNKGNEAEDAIIIKKAVQLAVENLRGMRENEGQKLSEDLLVRGEMIRETVKEIEKFAPMVAMEYTQKLKGRIDELLDGKNEIAEERILMETAIFADKSNITEEIVRLDSHMIQLKKIINESKEPVGKKLDFLVQEMNREANTIGSKSNNMKITELMLEVKSEVEKIREQVQNIE